VLMTKFAEDLRAAEAGCASAAPAEAVEA
jgi:hypothetical protein